MAVAIDATPQLTGTDTWQRATLSSLTRCAGVYGSLAAAVVIWDQNSLLWYANPVAEQLWAIPLAQLRGLPASHLLEVPPTTAMCEETLPLLPQLGAYDGPAYAIRGTGEHLAIRLSCAPVPGRTKSTQWSLTTLIEAPANSGNTGELLLERDLLQTLVDSAPDQVYIKDRQSRFTFANKAQAAYFGLQNPGDLLGKTDFDFFDPQVAQLLFQQEQEIMRTGVPLVGAVEDQSHHFGKPWWVQSTKVPMARQGDVVGLVGISRNITDLKLIQEHFAHRALHDPLTGLPNRALLLDRLEQDLATARRQATSYAVCILDLDHFKAINDLLGHRVGDRALQEVATRLSATLRQSDTMARLGGDEFAVLLPGANAEGAECAAARMHAALVEPADLGECRRALSVSIGIALYPEHAVDAATVLDCADRAMYAAKASGGTCTVFHSGPAGRSAQ